ncbi:hypothetical protein [Oscillatoria sp. FACHB-1406]|uniref:LIC_10190 family membrane protein n=1 Tax=Oscillatoria sp. FACHB-1406 TaxID=2692846 RepID=UPI00168A2300|nr:hypothetical protein [Oscillatoria sp. FACHB-1406]MBD2577585.1 hypothetical protein [Oscillatoria sp. FACHB-1406]
MIYFIAIWTLLAVICWVIGTAVLNALNAPEGTSWRLRAIAALWLGTIILAIALLSASLALPLSPLVGGAVAFGGAGIALLSAPTREELKALKARLSPAFLLGYFAIAALVAALMVKQVTWFDTGLYHFGSIRWMEKYGAVPGLALINSKFGFISSWFALAAPLNPESLGSHVTAVTNGFVLLLAIFQLGASLARIIKGEGNIADGLSVIFLAIAIFLMRFTTFMSAISISPSPDIPVIILTGMIAWTMLLIASYDTASLFTANLRTDARAIPLILATGAVTIKLSALPLLCIAWLFYLFDEPHKIAANSDSEPLPQLGKANALKRAIKGSAIAGVLLLPMVLVGLVTSGCPLYPSTLMCFNFSWSISIATTVAERTAINGWMSWFDPPPAGENQWFWLLKEWWNLANFNKVMIVAIVLSIAIAIYLFKTIRFNEIRPFIWLFALSGSGIVYIMTQAPLIRFGLGYFIAIPALLLAIVSDKLSHQFPVKLTRNFKNIFLNDRMRWLGLLLVSVAIVGILRNDLRENLFIPPELPREEVFEEKVNDIDYFIPADPPKCWAATLPCAPEEISKNVRLRNPDRGLDAGFVNRK